MRSLLYPVGEVDLVCQQLGLREHQGNNGRLAPSVYTDLVHAPRPALRAAVGDGRRLDSA